MDTKKCGSCRSIKTLDNFVSIQKEFKSCNSCRNYQRQNAERIKENVDRQKGCENSKKHYRIHKEEIKQRIALRKISCSQPNSNVSSSCSEIV